jgi:hypothetical protein
MLVLAALLFSCIGARAQAAFGTQAVGVSSTMSVNVSAQAAGTVDSVQVLTAGASGLDFTAGSGVSTCPSISLVVSQICTVSVAFTPGYPGLRWGAVVLLDADSNVLGATYLSGTGLGGLGVLVPGNLVTVAGESRTWTSTKDGVPATSANLDQPASVVLDGAGNMYIADSAHNKIRRIAAPVLPATVGIISTFAGTGDTGLTGDGFAATSATLTSPSGVALDGAGNLYVADTGDNVIRKITAATGIITTVAGTGTAGYAGDGLAATAAELNGPWGVTVDAGGNLYVADTANQRIRRVDAVTGIITTVAGNGDPSGSGDGKGTYSGDGGQATLAGLSLPYSVAFDAAGNMFIADSANNRVRKVDTSGIITTYAGSANNGYEGDGGAATAAWLHLPSGVALDAAGNLYIADTQNTAIRKVSAATGIISTLVVNGQGTTLSTAGALGPASLYAPFGLFVDAGGNVYFSDYFNMLVLEVKGNQAALDFTATPVRQGSESQPKTQTVENDGNAALDLTSILPDQNAAIDGGTTTCNTSTPLLAVDGDCTIGAIFAPSPSVAPTYGETGNVNVSDPAENSPLDIELIGDATAVNSTTTSLTSSLNPSTFGTAVTFRATVTTGSGTGSLTGTVSFSDGTATLATGVKLSGGVATFTTNSLKVGSHSITAAYSGDSGHFASTSTPALIQVVDEVTATSLTSSGSPSVLGVNVTFTATVTTPNGGAVVPDGTVIFSDGATILGSVALSGGVATYSTTALPQGLNAIQASYSGDAANDILASASTVLSQDVQAASTVAVTPSLNPSNYGDSVTFTATVTSNGSLPASGVVNFLDGGVQIGTANLAGSPGQGTFATASLLAGSHSITVAYQGTTDTGASTSPAITQVVNKATPTITWAAPAAITYGTALSATQLNASSNVPGALVYTPAAGTVLAAGSQTLSVTFTPTDRADYNSVTTTVSLTVNKATPTLVVTTSGTPSGFGNAVTFTAMVSTGPTGAVTFSDGGNSIGSGTLSGNVATFTTSSLTFGAHTITATWPGNSNYNAVTSNPITQTVGKATPVIAWPTPAPITYGTALSAAQLDATTTTAGSFVYSPALGTVLNAGSQTLSVTFTPADTGDYNTATATVTLVVNKATSAITWAAPAAITYGTALSAVQLDATANLPGTLVYTPAAGAVLAAGLQTLSVTFTPTDTADYGTATATVLLTVNKATPTIAVTTSGTPSNYGNAVTFTATVSSGPTGTATFYDAGNSIGTGTLSGNLATFATSTLAVGAHAITASWPGNSNYNAVTSSAITQTVNLAQTSTTLAAAPNPGIAGVAEAITATVKVVAGAATTTGTVTFTNGSVTLGSATLGAGGTVTIEPKLAPGSYSIVATYGGDANDGGSASAPFSYVVQDATTSVTVASTPNPSQVQTPVTFTAKVTGNGGTPTGSVSIVADGKSIGTASLDATGTATFTTSALAAGSHQITASYGGDANDSPSTSSAITQVVTTIPTVTALGVSTTTSGTTQQVILVALVLGSTGPTPTGTVTFKNGSTVIGAATLDSGGAATFTPNLANGTYSLVATYGGDALHSASTSNPVSISGSPTGYDLTVTPASVTMAVTQNATVKVTVTSNAGFADTIGLGCASLPAGVTCHFASQTATLAANGTATVQLTIDTNSPLSGGASAMNTGEGDRGVYFAGMILPFSLFFGWIFWRFRRRHAAVLTTLLVLLLAGAAMLTTGCGGFSQNAAAPGTYVIQVVGVGVNSNISHYQNVSLNITAK